MQRIMVCGLVIAAACSVQTASAHYLWVRVDGKTSIANLYFEEGAAPGDGKYLDPFIKRGQMWIRSGVEGKATPLKMSEHKEGNNRWMTAKVDAKSPRSFDAYCKWGVYRYGKVDVLLHYYARHISVDSREQLAEVVKAPHLRFVIEPRMDGDAFVLRVLFEGKPAANKEMRVQSPTLKGKLVTSKNGELRFKDAKAGKYYIRAYNVQADKSGSFEGKDYKQTRHHSTLLITLP